MVRTDSINGEPHPGLAARKAGLRGEYSCKATVIIDGGELRRREAKPIEHVCARAGMHKRRCHALKPNAGRSCRGCSVGLLRLPTQGAAEQCRPGLRFVLRVDVGRNMEVVYNTFVQPLFDLF